LALAYSGPIADPPRQTSATPSLFGSPHGAVMALGALMRFIILFKSCAAERLDVPILVLRGALLDLDEKVVDPLLTPPVRGRGRSRSSMAHEALEAHVAGAVQRLLQTGLYTADAHLRVANELGKLGLKLKRGSGGLTDTTVRHWCDEIAEDVSRSGVAAIVYDGMFTVDEVKRLERLPRDQARKSALKSLVAFVREVISAKPT
jgi:hypothetical protein